MNSTSSVASRHRQQIAVKVLSQQKPITQIVELLQFSLNHRTFMASRKLERRGKSPAELMTGEKHPHWLEMLGFQRFPKA